MSDFAKRGVIIQSRKSWNIPDVTLLGPDVPAEEADDEK